MYWVNKLEWQQPAFEKSLVHLGPKFRITWSCWIQRKIPSHIDDLITTVIAQLKQICGRGRHKKIVSYVKNRSETSKHNWIISGWEILEASFIWPDEYFERFCCWCWNLIGTSIDLINTDATKNSPLKKLDTKTITKKYNINAANDSSCKLKISVC